MNYDQFIFPLWQEQFIALIFVTLRPDAGVDQPR